MLKSVKKIFIALTALIGVFAVAGFVWAAAPDLGLSFGDALGLSNADPRVVASNIIRLALGFLGIIAVGLIIYAGFLWMTAAGDEDKIDRAKKTLVSAVIGLIIILSAFAIATFVLNRLLEATNNNGGGGNNGGSVLLPGTGGPGDPCVNSRLGGCQADICGLGLVCSSSCFCEPSGSTGTSCNGSPVSGVCQDNGNCDSDNFCDAANPDPLKFCTCQPRGGENDPCDADLNAAGCQAFGNVCQDSFFCDPAAAIPCTCQPGDGVGQPCDADAATAGCQADQKICSNDLTCDPAADCSCRDYPVIKWVSPSGGICLNDINKNCLSNDDCGGGTCQLNTPSAAPGNIISIGGRYFGATAGRILFFDGSGFNLPGLDPAVATHETACGAYWSDRQIIIVIPAGAKTGAIRVERGDNKRIDETNNDRGPRINDLIINSMVRPGLCRIANTVGKAEGGLDDTINYYGANLANGLAKFGSYEVSVSGKDSIFAATNGAAGVPNIKSGETTTFVFGASAQPSNYLEFNKTAEAPAKAFITSFEPARGASGQYVTISGSGFGPIRGSSDVYFGSEGSGYRAAYDFPDVCADSVWSDKQIIVKVPDSAGNGNYVLTIALGGTTVIDTAKLSPSAFTVDSAAPLLPSLCKISPAIGQTGTSVALWGEYFDAFDAANSRVRFFSGRDVSGKSNISFWDFDSSASGGKKLYKIETKVPSGASSGPVRVVKGSPAVLGNGLNFAIGSCLEAAEPDAACGASQVCCPESTYKAGRCAADLAKCAVDIPTSVYEFEFNTGLGEGKPGQIFGSCAEKSNILGTCSSGVCPNSPGLCSFFGGGTEEAVGDCIYSCDNVGACGVGGCSYNSLVDRCLKNDAACGLPRAAKDILNKDVSSSCADYKGSGRYIFPAGNSSCPSGWTKDNIMIGLNTVSACIDTSSSCVLCAAGFNCLDNGRGAGVCAAAPYICPAGSTCQSDNKCKKTAEASCNCCCRKDKSAEDCCAGLACEGSCGAGGNFGLCSGCTRKTGGNVDQAASDAACNCTGTTGKYCDASADGGKGVCGDCGELSGVNDCSNQSASCCVDNTKSDACVALRFGGKAGDVFKLVPQGGINYCGYYQCNSDNSGCLSAPSAKPTGTYFASAEECNRCGLSDIGLGKSCQSEIKQDTCALNICSKPFACLLEGGVQAREEISSAGCGFCCCNPLHTATDKNDPMYDSCQDLGKNVACRADQSPCSGDRRGLCCGCAANTECVTAGASPESQGCGNDSCCRARPGVENTLPADGATGVCANSEIRASFNQKMDISSFADNTLVIGEYGLSDFPKCPPGTAELAAVVQGPESRSKISAAAARFYDIIKGKFVSLLGKESQASAPPSDGNIYCIIAGAASGEQDGNGNTTLVFKPTSALRASGKYFAVIKGDENLDNKSGALNYWGIGLNAKNAGVGASPVDNTSVFRGSPQYRSGTRIEKNYQGAYIWSFTVLPDTGGNKGICKADRVKVIPPSYLFQTLNNDLNEVDSDSGDKNFDTASDRDKVFHGQVQSRDGQILQPVTGYSWNWAWGIDDGSIAVFAAPPPFAANADAQLVQTAENVAAQAGEADKKTKLTATINFIETADANISGQSDIHVFICANPWPPVYRGTWQPWLDKTNGFPCLSGSGTCYNMNYEFYYCRDQGEPGTADDLPEFSGNTNRGLQNDILKESFFFRQ